MPRWARAAIGFKSSSLRSVTMATRKRAGVHPTNPYMTSTNPDELSPTNRVACEILDARGDLLPSVDRIMNAGLVEADTLQALSLFQESLSQPGDPNRDPRVAIATVTGEPVNQS
jgi:hypothetical protein